MFSIIFMTGIVALNIILVQCQDATLYDHSNYRGDSIRVFNLENGDCQNIFGFNDRTTSVKNNKCLRIWADRDCTGRTLDITSPGQDNLGNNNFNDELTSVSSCARRPVTGVSEEIEIVMHLNGANDLAEQASKIQQLLTAWFPFIQNNVMSPFYKQPKRIDVHFDVVDRGVWTRGTEIHVPTQYIRNNKGNTGVFIHEMMHVLHQTKNCPAWITDGMAEYMRRWFYEPKTDTQKPKNQNFDNPDLGYWLLAYLNSVMGRPLIYLLNRACQEGTYSDNLLKDLSGRSAEEWWKIMVNDNNFPWKRLK